MDGALAIAEGLLRQPTVPFHEELPARHCVEFATERGLPVSTDAAGNVVLRYESAGADVDRPLVLVAHLDHPGFVVDAVAHGRLSMTFLGGVGAANATQGAPLHFFRRGEVEPVGRGACWPPSTSSTAG